MHQIEHTVGRQLAGCPSKSQLRAEDVRLRARTSTVSRRTRVVHIFFAVSVDSSLANRVFQAQVQPISFSRFLVRIWMPRLHMTVARALTEIVRLW